MGFRMAAQGSNAQRQDGAGRVWVDAGRHRPGDPFWNAPLPRRLDARKPWMRLLRREVEALVRKKHGTNYLKDRQSKTELAHINRELRRLKTQIARLEER